MIYVSLRISSVVHSFSVRMSSNHSYESAVRKLNLLQSNKSVIDQIRKNIRPQDQCKNIEDMQNYLSRTGVSLARLDQLSVIHVAGTKGKGSTSAMCESILRQHGFRTGFYSSPHLVAVRERIRLDGKVVSEATFADHFHRVYNMLDATKTHDGDMPGYFAFLTVLAFNTFLAEEVDVAVVEVGIGGLVDYTNVLRKVPVVGITALGLDHTAILGDSLPLIAAAKAGVMKRGCLAYTVRQQPDAMRVLRAVSDDVECPLTIVPDHDTYDIPNGYKMLQCNVDAYKTNASLAIQLAHAWMRKARTLTENKLKNKNVKYGINGKYLKIEGIESLKEGEVLHNAKELLQKNSYKEIEEVVCDLQVVVPNETWAGLQQCRWAGRYQEVAAAYARFYLDGAHTKESMEICAQWFNQKAKSDTKILIFSATGDRNADVLMKPLTSIAFTRAYFVVPAAYKATSVSNDNYSTVEQKDMVARCQNHEKFWQRVSGCETVVAECVADALVSIKKSGAQPSVLVTGSLHLVGAALSILDPNLNTYS